MNKILNIEEVCGLNLYLPVPTENGKGSRLGVGTMLGLLSGGGGFDGYKVTTEQGDYLVLISNEQNCCESWGYFSSNDDYKEFIGADLRGFKLTDVDLKTKKIVEKGTYDEGGIQFVDFETDIGVLQLAVYNSHNGYYGHSILVAIGDKIELASSL